MKTVSRFLALSTFLAFTVGSFATPIVETHDFNALNLSVPDGNPSGLGNLQSVTSAITDIESLNVTLSLSGTFNGDLYAYLTHGAGFTVLLNRSGRTAGDAFGYDGDGFSVTFNDLAANNIHTYQSVSIPAPGSPLTGEWQPDGRWIDPDLVVDTDPVTAPLASFVGQDANGDWTLFVADLSGGDTHQLDGWSLEITGIPEPGTGALLLLAASLLALRRHAGRHLP